MLKIMSSFGAILLALVLLVPSAARAELRDLRKEEANRQVVLEFYKDLDAHRRVKLLADQYIQHAPMLAPGKEAMVAFHDALLRDHPNASQRLLRVAATGDYVWVQFHIKEDENVPGHVAVGIYRLENGKIAEHWDVGQLVPENAVDLMTAAPPIAAAVAADAAGRNIAREDANRRLVVDFYERVFNKHDVDGGTRVMASDYKQHNPTIPTGRKAFVAFFKKAFKEHPKAGARIVKVAADGDLVWVFAHITKDPDDRGSAVVDIFRVRNGKLVEHWDVMQPVPEKSLSGNSMF